MRATSGPVLERAGDLAAILTNLEPGDVLFIDEIHRLGPTVEEILYPALEDFQLDLVIGQGPMARTVRIDLPRFTLVGATTRAGLITTPLQARFGIVHRLDFYEPDVLRVIIQRSAEMLEVPVDQSGANEIAARSRGTPRVANRLLRRVRDYAQIEADGRVDRETAKRALAQLDVDEYGLDEIDRRIMRLLIDQYGGGPAGIKALAASVGEDEGTIEDIYEPYLIQEGFLQRTRRGRVATTRAFEHLGLPAQTNVQRSIPATANPTRQTSLADDLIDRVGWAVVRIVSSTGESKDICGSGTVVRESGLIYTNRHVVEGGEDWIIEVLADLDERPQSRYRAHLVGYSTEVDFAVLQIDRDEFGREIESERIQLSSVTQPATRVRRGDRVFVLGFPGIGDDHLALTEGTITTVSNRTVNGERLPGLYQTDAAIAPGNSGGLAVNKRGEMVGIPTEVKSEKRTGGRLTGILPVDAVRAVKGRLETDLSQIVSPH